uniref:Putative conserved plasma membrane protein n=1 Tax=Tabanus bromius TaxID=304241 RepID=A0A0K8TQ00_TABBR
MTLFQLKWLRRFVRKRTNPIPHDRAHFWKEKLSLWYMIVAWNALGYIGYLVYTGQKKLVNDDEGQETAGQRYAKMLKVDKGKIIRFEGVQKVSELDLNADEERNK